VTKVVHPLPWSLLTLNLRLCPKNLCIILPSPLHPAAILPLPLPLSFIRVYLIQNHLRLHTEYTRSALFLSRCTYLDWIFIAGPCSCSSAIPTVKTLPFPTPRKRYVHLSNIDRSPQKESLSLPRQIARIYAQLSSHHAGCAGWSARHCQAAHNVGGTETSSFLFFWTLAVHIIIAASTNAGFRRWTSSVISPQLNLISPPVKYVCFGVYPTFV
jgi:hypothetical protein